jgi:effector-binding domain-containing protein
MHKYIKNNDYIIAGNAIERTLINHLISKNPKDYITEIQIRVNKIGSDVKNTSEIS